jgi:hypothetical protein
MMRGLLFVAAASRPARSAPLTETTKDPRSLTAARPWRRTPSASLS